MKALITWASSWFGAEFARQLAAKGYDLILVARNTEKLTALWEELKGKYWIEYKEYAVDLWSFVWIENLCEDIIENEDIDLLINNAGRGNNNWFLTSTDVDQAQMMILNMTTIVLQSKRILKKWIREDKKWKIINVCSVSSFLFEGTWPLYSATKAFVRSISYWLDAVIEEAWKKDDIHIQCLCPGFAKTSFMGENFTDEDLEKLWFMEVDEVIKESLEALEKNEFIVIPWEANQDLVKWFQSAPTAEVRAKHTDFKKQTWLIF